MVAYFRQIYEVLFTIYVGMRLTLKYAYTKRITDQ